MTKRKKIAVTLGEPGGIGAEITLKALLSDEVSRVCRPVVIGSAAVIEEACQKLGIPLNPALYDIMDCGEIRGRGFIKGRPTAEGGRDCVAYIKKATELALRGDVEAIVTAPISKEAMKMAGFKWPGHTEMLAELTGTRDFAMVLSGGPITVILVTIHTSLGSVPAMITKERVLKTIVMAKKTCDIMGIKSPRIAVAGLNPHGGEAGMFGREEIEEIGPAVEEARGRGIPVTGPYPPDTLFHKVYMGEFDITVCMYHDQGLIPLKMIAMDKGVNMTVGLPFIRTSPDHGTAYDIAWQGKANPSSMIAALKMAASSGRVL
jgi:4-hydroxythreonine-4-phosphate dehydrogenase